MTAPKRIQRKRAKGWRMPEGAVYVGRPTIFGNPFGEADFPPDVEGGCGVTWKPQWHEYAADLFREWAEAETVDSNNHAAQHVRFRAGLAHDLLRDKDLVCWCPTWMPCHADVLLDIANRTMP